MVGGDGLTANAGSSSSISFSLVWRSWIASAREIGVGIVSMHALMVNLTETNVALAFKKHELLVLMR